MASGAAGHEADRVAACRAGAPVASAQPAHPVAVLVDPEAEAPRGVVPEDPVWARALRGDRFGEHPGAQQAARGQGVVEAGHRRRGSVTVDGGNLGRPPGGAVDHRAVKRPGRVGDGLLVQRRTARRGGRAERVVQAGQVHRPGLLPQVQPEGEVQPARPADLLPQELPDAAPVYPADQLTDQVPVEQRRLAVRSARLPRRPLRRQQRAQPVPVVEGFGRHRAVQHHHSGLMRQHVTDRRRSLEFRPVPPHRRVQIEPPGLHQAQRAHRRERLAHRIRLNQAAGFPPPAPFLVGVAAPQVNHQSAVAPHGERRASARLGVGDLGEALAHWAEPPVSKPLDLHVTILPRPGARIRREPGPTPGRPGCAGVSGIMERHGIWSGRLSLGGCRSIRRAARTAALWRQSCGR